MQLDTLETVERTAGRSGNQSEMDNYTNKKSASFILNIDTLNVQIPAYCPEVS
ncbi:MAG: hypothetical protein ABIQ21_03770 [Chryseolinea sp.]